MSKGTTQSRRQRRFELKRANMLKVKNMFSPLSAQRQAWYSKMREDGNAAHEAHLNRVNDSIGDQLELRLKGNYNEETGEGFYGLRNTWSDMGYNDSEIAMLEEAWTITTVKDKDTYREDKKIARQLVREAKESRKNRV